MKRILTSVLAAGIVGVLFWNWGQPPPLNNAQAGATTTTTAVNAKPGTAIATLAGGCFWCMESTFEKIDGVHEVVSGYTGGHLKNPTYQQVGGGGTGHTEAVQIYYDPAKISYPALLYYMWREIDPTDDRGQFADRGDMYRPAIYYHNETEHAQAIASRDALQASARFANAPIAVEITAAEPFYKAEGYHQNYYKTNPYRYKIYRHGSGRDQFLERLWGDELHAPYPAEADAEAAAPTNAQYHKPDEAALKATLNDMQYAVTQHEGTEPPFRNEYWDNKRAGIYVDVVSGEPLFSSAEKYRSGTGWPSFSKPIDGQFLVERTDYKLIYPRTELRSKFGDSHLGHLFKDGPPPTGLRYCINSAALRFVAKTDLEREGYGEYIDLLE